MGTLVVPYWPSAPFWPMIYPGSVEPAAFIKNLRVFPKDFQPVNMGTSGNAFPAGDILALKCCFGSINAN